MTDNSSILRPPKSHYGLATLKTLGSFSLTSLAPTLAWTTDGPSWFESGPASLSFLQVLLRSICADSFTSVEHASAARGQFAMMRRVRQGCRGYLFTMAFDSVYRWLISAVLPPEPFLQRSACACADDFAPATASLRESFPIVADAFAVIALVTGMSLNYQK